MKIAIIVWAFPPKWLGGAEIATYNIARHLAQRGNCISKNEAGKILSQKPGESHHQSGGEG